MTYKELLQAYRKKHGKFVVPKQGFNSLRSDLWLAYSMGRVRGFTDLGTYANKPGDHGYWPSYAFDLGRKDRFLNKGWGYVKARRLAKHFVKHHKALKINYVILGLRIWSMAWHKEWDSENGWERGWHRLRTGDTSHMFHIHVSGVH